MKVSRKSLLILSGILGLLSICSLFFGERVYYTIRIFFGRGNDIGAIPSSIGLGLILICSVILIFYNEDIEKGGIIAIILTLTVSVILEFLAIPIFRIFNSQRSVDLIVADGYKISIFFAVITLVLTILVGFSEE